MEKNITALERDAEKRQAKAFIITLIAGVFVIGLLWPLGLAVGPAAIIMSYILLRIGQPSNIVLWFRRFHNKDLKASGFPRFLKRSAYSLFVPVTIRDTIVKRNLLVNPPKILLTIILSQLLFFLGIPFLLFMIVFLLSTYTRVLDGVTFSPTTLTFGLLAIYIVLAVILFFYYRAKGKFDLSTSQGVSQAIKIRDAIKSRSGLYAGSVILECADINWQIIVKKFLREASAVIIDVENLNDNVAWELKQALKVLPPESIILTFPEQSEGYSSLPPELKSQLNNEFGEAIVDKFKVFIYPPKLPNNLVARIKALRDNISKLRSLIIDAIRLPEDILYHVPLKQANVLSKKKSKFSEIIIGGLILILLILTGYLSRFPNSLKVPLIKETSKQTLTIKIPMNISIEKLDSIKISLKQIFGEEISSSVSPEQYIKHGKKKVFKWEGRVFEIFELNVDEMFFLTFDPILLQGRMFSDEFTSDQNGNYILNEAAENLFSKNAQEKIFSNYLESSEGDSGQVIGILKNFRFGKRIDQFEPVIFTYNPEKYNYLFIELSGVDTSEAKIMLINKWPSYFSVPPLEITFSE